MAFFSKCTIFTDENENRKSDKSNMAGAVDTDR